MKYLLAVALIACAYAAPQEKPQEDVQILRYDNENSGLNSYQFAYELSDGSKREEKGELKNAGSEQEALSVTGSYTWVDPEGITYTVTFIADENGFQPTIEQGPGGGVPPAVIASLLG